MYFSRLLLNRNHMGVRRDLRDCYQMHMTIMRAFPRGISSHTRKDYGILYRVEIKPVETYILVQSTVRPNWALLSRGYLSECIVKDLEIPSTRLQAGAQYQFWLRANPSKRCVLDEDHPSNQKGKRQGLIDESDRLEWLTRQGEKFGFQIQHVDVWHHFPPLSGFQPSNDRHRSTQYRHICLVQTEFEGVLRILDGSAFQTALEHGIGPGKAFGMGLLSISSM